MKNPSLIFQLIFIFIFLPFSCETHDEDVIDPESVGKWMYFNISNGLTDNFIWDIMEDNQGNIWVGTDMGVDKYDGMNWESITTRDGLLDNVVLSIEQDVDGIMWFGTQYGLSIQTNIGMLNIDSLYGESFIPYKLFSDSRGRMWIGTFNGIYKVEPTGVDYIYFDEKESCNSINNITEDNSGKIWFATEGGAVYYDNSNYYFMDSSDGLVNDDVRDILQDSWGDIWFGSYYGKYATRYDGMEMEYINLFHGMTPVGVVSMVLDNNGNIWFTTPGAGVIRYNGIETEVFRENDGLRGSGIYCSLVDKNGNIWFGSINSGISIYIPE